MADTTEDYVDVVFDGPPGPVAGRFVEVENMNGASCHIGEWVHREDGYWVLRITWTAIGDYYNEQAGVR